MPSAGKHSLNFHSDLRPERLSVSRMSVQFA
jgi:hypothetical protein